MAQGNFGAPVIKGPWTSGMDRSLKIAALTAPGWAWPGLAHGFPRAARRRERPAPTPRSTSPRRTATIRTT